MMSRDDWNKEIGGNLAYMGCGLCISQDTIKKLYSRTKNYAQHSQWSNLWIIAISDGLE